MQVAPSLGARTPESMYGAPGSMVVRHEAVEGDEEEAGGEDGHVGDVEGGLGRGPGSRPRAMKMSWQGDRSRVCGTRGAG